MAFNLCRLLFIYLFLNQLSLFVSSFQYDKPEILSKFETVIESGNNYTFVCQGNAPLKWQLPEIDEDSQEYKNWTTVTFKDVFPVNGTYTHGSRLFIQNATFPFTGYYRCYSDGADPSDESVTASVYLYVRDEEHLAVKSLEIDTVIVTQYSDAIIPCRPTSPDVDVQLTLVSGEKMNATYDPKTGFRFNVARLSDEEIYCCNFLQGSFEYDTCVYLKVIPLSHGVAKPILEEVSDGHTVVGGKLILECKVKTETFVDFKWITPTGDPNVTRVNISHQWKDHELSLTKQRLTIHEATLEDKGTYYCNVSDMQNHSSISSLNITIYDKDDHFINLTEENNKLSISTVAGEEYVVWRIDVRGHPKPKLFWLNNKNDIISSLRKDKYEISFSGTDAVLKIKDISIRDFGNYTLVAQNDFNETKSLQLFLNVTDKPTVDITSANFHMVNEKDTVECIVAAHPLPDIYWFFKPCLDNSCMFEPINQIKYEVNNFQVTSSVNISSLNTGYVKCSARNSLGEDEMDRAYYVTDVKNGFDIFDFGNTVNVNDSHVEVALDEPMKMVCGASIYNNYTSDMEWIHDGVPMKLDERYRIDKSRTPYTNRYTLNIERVSYSDAGEYSCRVRKKNKEVFYKNFTLIVSKPSKPVILTEMKDMEVRLPRRLHLWCEVKGIPKPTITWLKDNVPIRPSNITHFNNNNQHLEIHSLDYKDDGNYKCEAKNRAGSVSKQMTLTIKNKPVLDRWLIWVIAALALLTIVLCYCMFRKINNERKLQRELRIAGLANFEKGAIESLNPELGIDDQAELLPYDKKREFPIEKLKLGKQLGSGAFGVVMKGVAKGIVEGEESTIVAVKMVKKNADNTYIKALASELKIMVHLGKHLNVVNLLGACTKNVTKKELLVIVEYCRFGNLQNYLLRHRENFIDQVDPTSGHIDYMIGQDVLERTYSVCSNRSNTQSPYMKYAALSFSNSSGPHPSHMVDYRGDNYHGTTAKTDITTVSMSPNSEDEECIISNNSSIQPEWRSNYHGDYKDKIRPICTKDLLAWAFQVSRGMEYLESRRVLHGDLAARNILLADNNIVKICDFGLAKSMYKSDNYKKKGDGPLPVKWMAIESIRDKVFSTQSDVWSFGIVLWEFFSLAKTPYPGMEADERLYNKLLDGYRMESPEYAPKEIYKMMCDCWHAKPTSRPTFARLSERIGSLLEDTVRKHYIDLNDPYLVMNTQRLEDGHSDYLAMLSPPNFENLSSPRQYINDLPQNEDTPGYLPMNSAHIFSPRPDEGSVFNFDVNNSKIRKDKNAEGGVELVPMLGTNNDSDCDSSTCNSPVINSVSNPVYHLPPIVENDKGKSEKDIVKSADNYVNMPQNKSVLKGSNPFIAKNVADVHYVNSNSRDWESVQL